jgi:hypothetical protein
MRKTNHDAYLDRLSEYLDGTLSLVERVQVRRHLDECTSCAAVLAELRAVVARASDLRGDLPSDRDLFPGIVAGIEGRPTPVSWVGEPEGVGRRAARASFGRPQRIAASVALLAVAGVGAWLARTGVTPVSEGTQAPQAAAASEEPLAVFADERTDAVIAELENGLAENRSLLDPSTVGAIEANLAILDAALAEARLALAEDPGSTYLNHHLADTLRRKLQLLRDANALAQQ